MEGGLQIRERNGRRAAGGRGQEGAFLARDESGVSVEHDERDIAERPLPEDPRDFCRSAADGADFSGNQGFFSGWRGDGQRRIVRDAGGREAVRATGSAGAKRGGHATRKWKPLASSWPRRLGGEVSWRRSEKPSWATARRRIGRCGGDTFRTSRRSWISSTRCATCLPARGRPRDAQRRGRSIASGRSGCGAGRWSW